MHIFNFVVLNSAIYLVQCDYFDVEMREGRIIKGNGQFEFDLKVKRANKTVYAVSGNMITHTPLNDSHQVGFVT